MEILSERASRHRMSTDLRVSIVIICWNDEKYILDCLTSVYQQTRSIRFEVIVVDNASTDASVASVRREFPQVRVIENETNLGFGAGNNVGFRAALGEYVLILNPDTVIRDRAIEKIVEYADCHPEGGAFGCRVLNCDGSFQHTAQPSPTVGRYLVAGLCLRWLGKLSNAFLSDTYYGWSGETEREVDFQAACCLLVRTQLLRALGGFDQRFLHQFEDADLCYRIWQSGSKVLFCPHAEIIHLGGRNRGTYPVEVILQTERSRCRYFFKHYGSKGIVGSRLVALIAFGLRYLGYRLLSVLGGGKKISDRAANFRVLLKWHWHLDPIRFVTHGLEPDLTLDPVFSRPSSPAPTRASD